MAKTKLNLKKGILTRDAEIARLRAVLALIEDNDDPDLTVSDLVQHDRHAGFKAGVRAMADIARAASHRSLKEELMPKLTLTYTEDEMVALLMRTIAADRGIPSEKVGVRFNVVAGMASIDPRERHDTHLESVTIEIDL